LGSKSMEVVVPIDGCGQGRANRMSRQAARGRSSANL
jgi:hypothetical protein